MVSRQATLSLVVVLMAGAALRAPCGLAEASELATPLPPASALQAWDSDGSGTLSLVELDAGLHALFGIRDHDDEEGEEGEDDHDAAPGDGDSHEIHATASSSTVAVQVCANATAVMVRHDADDSGELDSGEAGGAALEVVGCLYAHRGAACGVEADLVVGGEMFTCAAPNEEDHADEDDEDHDDEDEDDHADEEAAHPVAEGHVPALSTGGAAWECVEVVPEVHDDDVQSPATTAERWLNGMGATIAVSLVSLVGIFVSPKKISSALMDDFGALAVGALLSAVFLHMLPEAAASDASGQLSWRVGVSLLGGLVSAYAVEHSIRGWKASHGVSTAHTDVHLHHHHTTTHHHHHDTVLHDGVAAPAAGHAHGHGSNDEPPAAHAADFEGSVDTDAHVEGNGGADGAVAATADAAVVDVADVAVTEARASGSADVGASSEAAAADGEMVTRHSDGTTEAEAEPEPEAEAVAKTPAAGADGDAAAAVSTGDAVAAKSHALIAGDVAGPGTAQGEATAHADAGEASGVGGLPVAPKKTTRDRVAQWQSVVFIVLFGDLFHNLVDGLVLGAAFSACDAAVGWSVAVAVMLHETPQEVTDYLILRRAGLSRREALQVNLMSASSAVLGAVVALALGETSEQATSVMLAFSSGVLVFLAATDIMPELLDCKDTSWEHLLRPSLVMLLGMVLVGLTTLHDTHCEAPGAEGGHEGH